MRILNKISSFVDRPKNYGFLVCYRILRRNVCEFILNLMNEFSGLTNGIFIAVKRGRYEKVYFCIQIDFERCCEQRLV